MANPVTLKFILKGQIALKPEVFTLESGEVLEYDRVEHILVPSKKNQKIPMVSKNGKPYLLPSEQYRIWREEHHDVFSQWNVDLYNKGISLPIHRCKLKFIFYFPDIKTRDLFNKAQTIEDELVTHKILLDDSFTVMNKGYVEGYLQRQNPRTEVYITIIDRDSPEWNIDKTPAAYYEKQKEKKAIQRRIQRAKKRMNK